MILNVTLTNFRQHKNLHVDFNSGVTVVRGENEGGKTTLLEAIMFAMFGVSACRNNDLTTWDEAKSSHKVQLNFVGSDSETYRIIRSQRSAELVCTGSTNLMVSGQTDVTAKVEELLGLKPGVGEQLMFVGQGSTRGILAKGGQADAIKMIESLAELDLVENLITLLQDNFNTGGRFTEQSLATTNERIDFHEATLKGLPDLQELILKKKTDLSVELDAANALKSEAQTKVTKLTKLRDQASESMSKVRAVHSAWTDYQVLMANLRARAGQLKKNLEKPLPEALEPLDYEQVVAHREKLERDIAATMASKEVGDYHCGEEVYSNREVVAQLLAQAVKGETDTRGEVSVFRSKIKDLEKEISELGDGICKSCGTELRDADAIAKHGEELEQRKQDLERDLGGAEFILNQIVEQVKRFKKLDNYPVPKVDPVFWETDGKWPPTFTWVGGTVEGSTRQTLADYNSMVREHEYGVEDYNKAVREHEAYKVQLNDVDTEVLTIVKPEEISNEMMDNIQADYQRLVDDVDTANGELLSASRRVQTAESQLENVMNDPEISALQEEKRVNTTNLEHYRQRLEDLKAEAKDMEVNKDMLKFLRQVKPQIADQVWNEICLQVSSFFSQMRGQESVVTRDGGFLVDGKNVPSLSGSTLDMLGLAIRVALTKTFLPTTTMLLLDEPFAACDEDRQARALAFLTQCGFEQVVIITHEESTQAVADHLISL